MVENYNEPALYISHPRFLCLSPSTWTIILPHHILFTFSHCGMLQHIHPLFLIFLDGGKEPNQMVPPPCLSFSREVSTISLVAAG